MPTRGAHAAAPRLSSQGEYALRHTPPMNFSGTKCGLWLRRLGVAIAGLLLLWLLLWAAVPPLLKWQIQKQASAALGRSVTLGGVQFRPWTLELSLSDLAIAGVDAAPPLFTAKRLYADAELQSFLRLAPVVDALRIEQPALRLTRRADGALDVDDILRRLSGPAEPKPAGEPARFVLYNLAIHDGRIALDDQVAKRQHVVEGLEVQLPFLSSLASKREVDVEPRLAFTLNGSRFDSSASSLPFAATHKTAAQLHIAGLDLAPYLAYAPPGLPVALQSGVVDVDLRADFERADHASLKLSGTVQVKDVKALDAQGGELLRLDALKVQLADVRPLERQVHLASVEVDAPTLAARRDAQGRINLLLTDGRTPAPATAHAARTAAPPTSAPSKDAAAPGAWQVRVDRVAVREGRVAWRDDSVRPAAAIDVTGLGVTVDDAAWPMAQPARFSGEMAVAQGRLRFEGQGSPSTVKAQLEASDVPLSLAAPYLASTLNPAVDGRLGGRLGLQWSPQTLLLTAERATLDSLSLTEGKTALAAVGHFEVRDAQADLKARTLSVGSLTATEPRVRVERDEEQRWMYQRWLRTPDASTAPVAQPRQVQGEPPPPWRVRIAALSVDGGDVEFADRAQAGAPVEVKLASLRLRARDLDPASAAASPVELAGRITAGTRSEPGRFDFKGSLAMAPVALSGRLEATGLPVHAFQPYYGQSLNVDVRRAFAAYRGTLAVAVQPAGVQAKLSGDLSVDDLRVDSVALTAADGPATGAARGERLLRWKTLALRGFELDQRPRAALRLDVRETTLTDAFARIIVQPSGRLNLQAITRQGQQESERAAAERPAPRTASARGGASATTNAGETGPASAPAPAPATARAEAAPGLAPIIHFGPISVVNARVDFSDLFVKPNYSADLTELTGRLSAFSSEPADGGRPALADLELRGKAQQTASLEILGKLNPLAKPLELDIAAKVRDLELAPLSPYSIRYAGHGIERGKMSVDVHYQVAPDGRLTATNKLVLNQLAFGDEVKDAPNSLPVRLAVALLADRNGVIDVDLPLSGSLNDPQFSIGPLIWKGILNLIAKAVTSPFSLLTGGLGGGSSESSVVPFALGSDALSDAAKQSLDKVEKALGQRDGLRLTLVGQASLERERDALQRERLRRMALAEKRRAAVRGGTDPAEVGPVTDAEYPALLEAVYKRADIPKPRNLIGMAKSQSVAEMEKLLLPTIAVDEQSIRELAIARAAAVRDYLLQRQLPGDRIFLGAVRTRADGADWMPGTALALDMP